MKNKLPLEIKSFSSFQGKTTLGEFLRCSRSFTEEIAQLHSCSEFRVWIDTGWESGIDPGDPIYSSGEAFSRRFRLEPFRTVTDIDLVPQALNFAWVVANMSTPQKWISALLDDPQEALRGPAEITGCVNSANLALELSSSATGQIGLFLSATSNLSSCRLTLPYCESCSTSLNVYLKPVAEFSNANIVIVDNSFWRRRFDLELQKRLSKRWDIAVGWRTFVRNMDAVDSLLSLDYANAFLDGVLLSFGDTVADAESPESIAKMKHVAELLMAEHIRTNMS